MYISITFTALLLDEYYKFVSKSTHWHSFHGKRKPPCSTKTTEKNPSRYVYESKREVDNLKCLERREKIREGADRTIDASRPIIRARCLPATRSTISLQ